MTTLPSCEPRLQRLLAGIVARRCDTALLLGTSHAGHVLGYQRMGSGGLALIVTPDGEITVLAPLPEVEPLQQQAPDAIVVGYGDPSFGFELAMPDRLAEAAAKLLAGRRVAVATDVPGLGRAIAQAAGADCVPIDDLVRAVRLVKDDDELARLARAYRVSLAAQDAIADSPAGASEIELLSLAQTAAQMTVGGPVEFAADLLVGERTALVCTPIAVPGSTRAREGDAVLADIALRHDAYWGDTARTVVTGSNEPVEAARAALRELLRDVTALLRPGTRAADVHAFVAGRIAERYPRGRFPHHAGHGVGVTAFEPPHLVPADHTELAERMVVAIEPGVYFEGAFGVREEDTFVVTADGGVDLRDVVPDDGS